MSHYSHYQGRSVGRLLHFLSEYCRPCYDRVVFEGTGLITLGNHAFATYTWDGDTDVPTFVFKNEVYNRIQAQQKESLLRLEAHRKAILGRAVNKLASLGERRE